MLTRNCEKFLNEGDFNVRLTLFDRDPVCYAADAYYKAWIETIRDSLGGGIVNSSNYYKFVIRKVDKKGNLDVVSSNLQGKDFNSYIKEMFPFNPTSIRIDVYEFNRNPGSPRSWIILAPENH